jgi:hypothetical protein
MKSFEELKYTPSYWLVKLQCDLADRFKQLGINVENAHDIAEDLDSVSAGVLLDLINGESNMTLEQLVELSVYFKLGVDINFEEVRFHMQEEKPVKSLYDLFEEEE